MRSRLSLVLLTLVGVLALATAFLWTPDKASESLEARYLQAASDYIDVAGIKLHVRDSGPKSAPALIMLHGLAASLHTWEPWAQTLSKDFRVIRYDLPGFGLTGADPTNDYSEARSMQVLAALMDKLGVDRASIIGNSMGGRLAWRFAAEQPARVTSVVLISPDGFESPGYEYGKGLDVPVMVKMMRYVLPKSFLRASLEPAYADPTRLTPEAIDRYYDMLIAPGVRDAMIARMGQTILVPPPPLLQKIAAPVLLLWGEKDALIPVTNAADYQKDLKSSTIAKLPDLGHVPHEEAPDVSVVPVIAFLKQQQTP
jgi:pimeloyl-ACP methyl ester carboxylesterase